LPVLEPVPSRQFDGRDAKPAQNRMSNSEGKMLRIHKISLAMLALVGTTAAAQGTALVPVSPDSKLWIEGTSTIHDWTCKATSIDAAIEVDAAAVQLAVSPPKMLKKVLVKVPVKSLKCGHGGMDDNMYKALKADSDPQISYILASFEPANEEATEFMLKTVGTLKIAGTENRLAMDVSAVRLPDGTLKATGTVPIKMTDFGIKPPTAIFGRIKAGDNVKVKFELTVGPKTMAALTDNNK
jgi:polyisoprenoid-binding protein YceI